MTTETRTPATASAEPTLSRRGALRLAGAAALAGGSLSAPNIQAQTTIPTFDRLDHVYFVLNIHWLQLIMYSHALNGTGPDPVLLGLPAGTARTTFPATNFSRTPVAPDETLRTFKFRMLPAEITQVQTLMAIANSLDGPGKIANLRAPAINYAQRAILNDGFSQVFNPLFVSFDGRRFNLTIEDHFLTAIVHFKKSPWPPIKR
jgi:hypothetical protein